MHRWQIYRRCQSIVQRNCIRAKCRRCIYIHRAVVIIIILNLENLHIVRILMHVIVSSISIHRSILDKSISDWCIGADNKIFRIILWYNNSFYIIFNYSSRILIRVTRTSSHSNLRASVGKLHIHHPLRPRYVCRCHTTVLSALLCKHAYLPVVGYASNQLLARNRWYNVFVIVNARILSHKVEWSVCTILPYSSIPRLHAIKLMICKIPAVFCVTINPFVERGQERHVDISIAAVPGKFWRSLYSCDMRFSIFINVTVDFQTIEH